MAKFDLRKAREAAASAQTTHIKSGYHRMSIVQVAEVGLQKAYNPGDAPVESCGFTFENADGQQVAKVMPLKMSEMSNFQKMLRTLDGVDKLEDILGKQLDVEIEENGKYPKIRGYYPVDDEMSGQPEITDHSPLTFFTVEELDPEVAKTLHRTIREAISVRISSKESTNEEV